MGDQVVQIIIIQWDRHSWVLKSKTSLNEVTLLQFNHVDPVNHRDHCEFFNPPDSETFDRLSLKNSKRLQIPPRALLHILDHLNTYELISNLYTVSLCAGCTLILGSLNSLRWVPKMFQAFWLGIVKQRVWWHCFPTCLVFLGKKQKHWLSNKDTQVENKLVWSTQNIR